MGRSHVRDVLKIIPDFLGLFSLILSRSWSASTKYPPPSSGIVPCGAEESVMTHNEYVAIFENAIPTDRAKLEAALSSALKKASDEALAQIPRGLEGYNDEVQYLYRPVWVRYGLVQCWYQYRNLRSEGFHWETRCFVGKETAPGVWEALVEGRHRVQWTWDLSVPNPQEVLGRMPEVYADGPSV
jgi:hypothetical protein